MARHRLTSPQRRHMDSCGCDEYATPIDQSIAREDRASYHSNGPGRTTRMLLDMIETNIEDGATVLDVGGGSGSSTMNC